MQNKFNNQQDAIQQQQQSTQSSSDADSQYQNSFYINGEIWNNVSLTSMNGTSSLSSTPRFSLSELFKPINTLTTTTASFTTLTTTPPPVPPSTPNNQLATTPTSSTNAHSIPNSAAGALDQAQLSLAVNNIEDQVKMHMFSMSLDSPYLSSSNNSSQSTNSDLRQYSSSPGSRFRISQVDQSKFLRSNSVNETASEMDEQANRSAPINTGSSGNSSRMMRSCSLGSYSRYEKNERASRSGSSRFSISPVPDNEMVSSIRMKSACLSDCSANYFRSSPTMCSSACSFRLPVTESRSPFPEISSPLLLSFAPISGLHPLISFSLEFHFRHYSLSAIVY